MRDQAHDQNNRLCSVITDVRNFNLTKHKEYQSFDNIVRYAKWCRISILSSLAVQQLL